MKKLKPIHYVQIAAVIVVYVTIMILARKYIVDAPTLIKNLRLLYDTYGYALVFFGALLEGTFIVGLYLPGSLVVLLGAALAKTGVVSFPLVILLAVLGFNTGYSLNYLLGKYGWYHFVEKLGFRKQVDHAKAKLEKYEVMALLFGYVMPSSASFLTTAAGMLKLPFKRFLISSLLIQTGWTLLWGTLAYVLGLTFVEYFIQYFGFVVIIGLAIYFYKKMPEIKGEIKDIKEKK
jgi:membrane protein DedA with SNARE-associated domain